MTIKINLIDVAIVAVLVLTGHWLIAVLVVLIAALPSMFPAFWDRWRTFGLVIARDGKFVGRIE